MDVRLDFDDLRRIPLSLDPSLLQWGPSRPLPAESSTFPIAHRMITVNIHPKSPVSYSTISKESIRNSLLSPTMSTQPPNPSWIEDTGLKSAHKCIAYVTTLRTQSLALVVNMRTTPTLTLTSRSNGVNGLILSSTLHTALQSRHALLTRIDQTVTN